MSKKFTQRLAYILLSATCMTNVHAATPIVATTSNDPYLWLENIDSTRSLDWVKQQNGITKKNLSRLSNYAGLYDDALKILTSTSRIPQVEQHGEFFYNLW